MKIDEQLASSPFALVPRFISAQEATELRGLYDDDSLFRSRVVMERHAFGSGEYKYFANPMPPRIQELREELYALLRPIANDWMRRMGKGTEFPKTHQAFLDQCFASEQKRPTALLSSTDRAITTGCIKICTDRSRFRCRRRFT